MEGIIKDIVDKGEYFEVQIENPNLTISGHVYKKGHGWEEEVTFDGVTKPRWLIHLEEKYKKREETMKKPVKDLSSMQNRFIGKRMKDGKLED